ncbi:hypothetical protein [Stenotrophomonas sp. MMGLT7]|uniref:hypothetical protein n=1 Tax=Stenotrophomonas sp. MMGLT7 TaxID=2901227 RepID=UPI001E4F20EC|nr:hypothetical protein [Stenotrophomonas sp. MMGLT7]MCD7096960.1 hypothetical protein [Stenotrophomonas sp. MMGLT7]
MQATVPAAQAATPDSTPAIAGLDLARQPDCSALVQIHVTHNVVTFTAVLDMGGKRTEQREWTRRTGPGKGWVCSQQGGQFIDTEDHISRELAEFVDGIDFPFSVANMLPGKKASPETVAKAVQEVGHG